MVARLLTQPVSSPWLRDPLTCKAGTWHVAWRVTQIGAAATLQL